MKNSKLAQVINQLSSTDIRSIRKFLRSPFFNQRQDVIDLFEYMVATGPDPIAEKAFEKLNLKRPFDLVHLRLVMSYLFRLIEKYLAVEELLENEETQQLQLIRAYQKRSASKQITIAIKEGIQNLEKSRKRNGDWYYYIFQLQLEQFQLESQESPSGELNRQELSDTLDIAYLIAKLRQACLLIAHQGVYKSSFDIGLLDFIFPFLKEPHYLEIPAVAVYYHCYCMLANPEDEHHFKSFKKLLLSKGMLFSDWEIRDLYLQAINYCIKRINGGAENYFSEVMDFYKEGLNNDYLLEKKVLSRFTYHNIVAAAIMTQEFEWVDHFIYKYKKNLQRKYRESSFSFSLAKLEYHRKNYAAALELLQKSNYRDLLLNLGAKTVLIKIYYELEEIDLLEAHLEAMKNYIRRKRLIGYHQKNYQNIIQLTKKLLSINFYNKDEKRQLIQLIETADPLTEREWLMQQLKNNL